MTKLTSYEEKQVLNGIAQCDRYIEKQERLSADLRPAATQKLLDYYKRHKQKLINALSGDIDPAFKMEV